MHQPALPPIFQPSRLEPPAVAFVAGAGRAAAGAPAGTLLWVDRADRLDVAVVLEPDLPRRRCLLVVYVALLGLGDALGALLPPRVPVTFGWPDRLELDGATAAGARVRIGPAGTDGVPLWLVLGVELSVGADGARDPDRTSVHDVGAGELDVPQLLEAFSRHLLTWLHTFETEGFAPVRAAYLNQARAYRGEISLQIDGVRRAGRFAGLTDDGDLILRRPAGIDTVSLAAALAQSDG